MPRLAAASVLAPLLVGLLAVGASAASALRRSPLSRSKVHSTAFDDLAQCEVAYDDLFEQCSTRSGRPRYTESRSRNADLVGDEDGGSIVNDVATGKASAYGRTPYKPPDNWDYRLHGDDWDQIGQCGGPNQSPIDLTKYVDVQGQTKYLLWFDYYVDPHLKEATEAKFLNDGHDLRYIVRPNGIDMGFVKIGKVERPTSEYIFHAPSEHSLDGAIFPLELQIYHQAEGEEGIVAVAIFFREGPSNPFLAALRASMGGEAPIWTAAKGRTWGSIYGRFPNAFDLGAVIPKGDPARERSFYNYQGSLTQPPCTTGVDWWVLSNPITASREEIRFIRRALFLSASMRHGNARSTMPIGNRTIFSALTGFQHALKTHPMPALSRLKNVGDPRGYSSGDMPWGPHWLPRREEERGSS